MKNTTRGSRVSQRNVLVFCVDEMRADHMGCNGNRIVATPSIDRLAGQGTVFRRAYCNNPICMPARSTMFTGLLPRDHGCRVNGQVMHPGLPVLPSLLADAGYRTHAAGKLHLTPWVPGCSPPDVSAYPECMEYWKNGDIDVFPTPYFGFQTCDFVGGHTSYAYGPYMEWLRERGVDHSVLKPSASSTAGTSLGAYRMRIEKEFHYNRFIADSTIDTIRRSVEPDADPFFIWCSFPDPHGPVACPEPYCSMYDPMDVDLPVAREGEADRLPPAYARILSGDLKPNGVNATGIVEEDWRELIALTYGMITHLDTEIGRVLDVLRETGLDRDTMVVFVADHGDMMGDHGLPWKAFYTFKGCVNIPFIMSTPGRAVGITNDTMVSQVDLMPSILDWCGVPMPGSDWVDTETPFQRGAEVPLRLYPGRSLLHLLDGREETGKEVVVECDEYSTGYQVRALVTDRFRISVYPGTREGELFDLKEDPDELHNLWYDAAAASIKAELLFDLLSRYSQDTPMYPVPYWNS